LSPFLCVFFLLDFFVLSVILRGMATLGRPRKERPGHGSVKCPLCGKIVQERGYKGHLRFGHKDAEGRALLAQKTDKTLERDEAYRARLSVEGSDSSGLKSEDTLSPELKRELAALRALKAAIEAFMEKEK